MSTERTYTIFGRRGGIVLLADGRTPAQRISAEQVLEFLTASIHIGTDLDRFLVIEQGSERQIPGSWFEELAA